MCRTILEIKCKITSPHYPDDPKWTLKRFKTIQQIRKEMPNKMKFIIIVMNLFVNCLVNLCSQFKSVVSMLNAYIYMMIVAYEVSLIYLLNLVCFWIDFNFPFDSLTKITKTKQPNDSLVRLRFTSIGVVWRCALFCKPNWVRFFSSVTCSQWFETELIHIQNLKLRLCLNSLSELMMFSCSDQK